MAAAARVGYRDLDYPAVVRLCDAFLTSVDFRARLPEISAPTRIVVGGADLIKGPAYAAVLHRHIRGSDLHIIDGAGHAVSWERPDVFNRLLMEFVSAVEPRD